MFKGWREFFSYSKSQRKGIYILLLLIFLLQAYLWYYKLRPGNVPLQAKVNLPEQRKQSPGANHSAALQPAASGTVKKSPQPFPFNPNKVSVKQLQQLGLSEAQAHTFVKYRNSGAVFKRPEDMLKVYSVSQSWYQDVKDFVKIETGREDSQRKEWTSPREGEGLQLKPFDLNSVTAVKLQGMGLKDWQASKIIDYRNKFRPYFNRQELFEVYGLDSALAQQLQAYARVDSAEVMRSLQVELNSADSISLAKVPGIGKYAAARIIKYRSRLGGFFSLDQLYEMYGADTARIQSYRVYLLLDSQKLRKLNINEASFKQLLQHPYLNYEIVKSIENYRTHVGKFSSIEQLRNIPLVDDVLFTKIANYLKIE